ncbi:hypothetical protein ONZ45_g18731 [Pleurotus djamor]|nr:hypothetical protein ONZ45_g18731 [Pleurotus djamor]
MIPKLHIKIRQAVFKSKISDPKAAAQGYCHTYFDHSKINLQALSRFPSASDIEDASRRALAESDSLLAILGIHSVRMRTKADSTHIQSIESWYTNDDNVIEPFEDSEDSELRCNEDSRDIVELDRLLAEGESQYDSFSRRDEEHFLGLTGTAISLAANDFSAVHAFVSSADEESMDVTWSRERSFIEESLPSAAEVHVQPWLPSLELPVDENKPMSLGSSYKELTFEELVRLRRLHQTDYAAKAVRSTSSPTTSETTAETARRKLIRKFHSLLRLSDEQGITTGVARFVRWMTSPPSSSDSVPVPTTGNSANAALAAGALHEKNLAQRGRWLQQSKSPRIDELTTALVSESSKLKHGTYGFVYYNGEVLLGRVEVLYSRMGGKNGKLAAIIDSDNIAAVTYIGLQVFEQALASTAFTPLTDATSSWQTKQYVFIPSLAFLRQLSAPPHPCPQSPGWLETTEDDHRAFLELVKCSQRFEKLLTLSRKRDAKKT